MQQQPTQGATTARVGVMLFGEFAADLDQAAVLHSRGAGGFAGLAGQAAIQVQLRGGAGFAALQHILDQIDAPARSVEFVAEQLVGRAGGVAHAAVHATGDDAARALGGFGVRELRGERLDLHGLILSMCLLM